MKTFKKLAAAVLAAISAVSVFTFTACGNEGGYGDKKSAQEATNVIENLDKVKTAGISVNGTVTLPTGAMDISALVNAGSGAFDVTLGTAQIGYSTEKTYDYYFMRDWKIYNDSSVAEKKDDFSASTNIQPVVDLGASLAENGVQSSMLNTVAPTIVNMVVSASNYSLLSFGKVTNSVAYKDGTITLDYNLAAYNAFNDVKSVIDGLEATTTVGDILNNATLKKYAQIYTELVTYNDLVTAVTMIKTMLEGVEVPSQPAPADEIIEGEYPEYPDESEMLSMATVLVDVLDTLLKTVTPDANSSTYDYLVKLISSDELKNIINDYVSQTQPGAALEKNLSEYSVKDIISLAMETELTEAQVNEVLKTVKAEVAEAAKSITREGVSVTEDSMTVTLSGMKYTFNYDSEYVLQSQGMEATITMGNSAMTITLPIKFEIAYGDAAWELATLPNQLPAFPEYGVDVID